jgi:hypothetical protein
MSNDSKTAEGELPGDKTGQDQLTDDRLALVSGGSIPGAAQTVSSPKPQGILSILLAEFYRAVDRAA